MLLIRNNGQLMLYNITKFYVVSIDRVLTPEEFCKVIEVALRDSYETITPKLIKLWLGVELSPDDPCLSALNTIIESYIGIHYENERECELSLDVDIKLKGNILTISEVAVCLPIEDHWYLKEILNR